MYNLSVEECFEKLGTSANGLSSANAKKRLDENGKNKLKEKKKRSILMRILDQMKNVLLLLLIFACVASVVVAVLEDDMSELINAGIILIIIVLNTTIGVVQEVKAEKAIEGLKDLTKPYAKVMRNGKVTKIKTEDIVVGDIVVLEAGDIVPADVRFIEANSIKINDATLTGESVAGERNALVVEGKNLPLGDRTNMAFMGSIVTYGRGVGIVTATGMDTELGKIANVLQETNNNETPLTKRLNKTVKILTYVVMIIAAVVFVVDMISGKSISESFMVAIALAICIVPEGLLTCLTLTMAMGVQRMSKQKAIVRQLPAVETLGSTQVICSDKTGTLTLNKMTVKEIFTMCEDQELEESENFHQLMNCMLLCNDTSTRLEEDGTFSTIGDPTETSLVYYGFERGFNKDTVNGAYPRLNEIPFDSERKLMTTLNRVGEQNICYTKGAVDNILTRCSHILDNGNVRILTDEDKEKILAQNTDMADKALRMLGFAYRTYDLDPYDSMNAEVAESNLTFVGIVGMIDPPRPEVKDAIATCKDAGITVIMITGDHKDTAFAIARELGIANDKKQVMTGKQLNNMSDEQLTQALKEIRVFARVNPEHKVRIVKALKALDKIVAMTGDGVNDAPSIKSADIGIGMGITGTDVTKEVSNIILTDDNFSTIVSAVKEGRKIYDNVLKCIEYLLSTGIAELIMLFTVLVILRRDFLNPALILWLNFVSDTVSALALGVEKGAKDIMKRKPNTHNANLLKGFVGFNILVYGVIQAFLVLMVYFIGYDVIGLSTEKVITLCFVTLVFIEGFHSYNVKDERRSVFASNPFDNRLLNLGFISSFVLTFLFIGIPIPAIQSALGITTLTAVEWLICAGVGFLMVPIAELIKLCIKLSKPTSKSKK